MTTDMPRANPPHCVDEDGDGHGKLLDHSMNSDRPLSVRMHDDSTLTKLSSSNGDAMMAAQEKKRRRRRVGICLLILLTLAGATAGIYAAVVSKSKSITNSRTARAQFVMNEPNAASRANSIRDALIGDMGIPKSDFEVFVTQDSIVELRFDPTKINEAKLREIGTKIQSNFAPISTSVRSFEFSLNGGQFLAQYCPPSNTADKYCNLERPAAGCADSRAGRNCSDCARNYFGSSCTPCAQCGRNQRCVDGKRGTGQCSCVDGRVGATCELCAPSYFGQSCNACPICGVNGRCNDGGSGNGTCVCTGGWSGPGCEQCANRDAAGNCIQCNCGPRSSCNQNGTCICQTGWSGASCTDCAPSHFGPQCAACQSCGRFQTCADGNAGNGTCVCMGGRSGSSCQTPLPQLNSCGRGAAVALTFDDGPHEDYTPILLQELRTVGLRATFYISPAGRGDPTPGRCEALKMIIADGHEVQSHTYHHADLTNLTEAQVRQELTDTWTWVHNCVGSSIAEKHLTQLRPPYGRANAGVLGIANSMGYTLTTWNLDSRDFDNLGQQAVITQIANQFVSGNTVILLMHDHAYRPGTLQLLISYFQQRGVTRFVTMTDCARMCVPSGCKDPTVNGVPFVV